MADVFLGYARADKERAERVAKALSAKGWSVWWDVRITPGSAWRKKIDEELLSARCVVILWSKAAIDSDYVIQEAQDGKDRQILVHALIEDVRLPYGFREVQAANLTVWDGSDSGEFARLCEGIAVNAPLPASDIALEGSSIAPSSLSARAVTDNIQSRQTATAETLIESESPPSAIRVQFSNHWRMAAVVAVLIVSAVILVAQPWRQDSLPAPPSRLKELGLVGSVWDSQEKRQNGDEVFFDDARIEFHEDTAEVFSGQYISGNDSRTCAVVVDSEGLSIDCQPINSYPRVVQKSYRLQIVDAGQMKGLKSVDCRDSVAKEICPSNGMMVYEAELKRVK